MERTPSDDADHRDDLRDGEHPAERINSMLGAMVLSSSTERRDETDAPKPR